MLAPLTVSKDLSRREFMRTSLMATLAAAAATVGYKFATNSELLSAGLELIPPLRVPEFVSSIAAGPDRLVAVGGRKDDDAEPAAWTFRYGASSWSRSADQSSFPLGTSLSAVTAFGGKFFAAGRIRAVNRTLRLIDDQTKGPVELPIFQYSPAIFSSADGAQWEVALLSVPGTQWGALTAIAEANGEERTVLAVGSRFLEPGLTESYGLIALASTDGRVWREKRLPGVVPPIHGGITLLTQHGGQMLLGTSGLRDSELYINSGTNWKQVGSPMPQASYVAAGVIEGVFVLAGVDNRARARLWKRTNTGWRGIEGLSRVPTGGRMTDIQFVRGAPIAAGSLHQGGFVTLAGGRDVR